MNVFTVSGNLTKDIETKDIREDLTVSTFGLAENDIRRDHTNYYQVEAWGGLGTNAAKYIGKGSKVLINGHIKVDQWDDDDGRHYRTTVIAEDVEFLDSRRAKRKCSKAASNN